MEATVNKKHALAISLAVGVAAIAGTVAATRTVHLGAGTSTVPASSTVVAQRAKALDRTEIALRKALAQRPPKLPPLPAKIQGSGTPAGAPLAAAPSQRVVYVRPAPIIRHVHRTGGDDHEAEGSSEHEGGEGFDD